MIADMPPVAPTAMHSVVAGNYVQPPVPVYIADKSSDRNKVIENDERGSLSKLLHELF